MSTDNNSPQRPDNQPQPTPGRRRLRRLSFGARLLLLGIGWVLVLIGIVGLALPGIQGILTIAFGAAMLSVASETVNRWLGKLLARWPRVQQPVDRMRQKIHRLFTNSAARDRDPDQKN